MNHQNRQDDLSLLYAIENLATKLASLGEYDISRRREIFRNYRVTEKIDQLLSPEQPNKPLLETYVQLYCLFIFNKSPAVNHLTYEQLVSLLKNFQVMSEIASDTGFDALVGLLNHKLFTNE